VGVVVSLSLFLLFVDPAPVSGFPLDSASPVAVF